jgi:maleate cis-trans isomerase
MNMGEFLPRYLLGTVLPRGMMSHYQPYQFYRLVPQDVMLFSLPLGVREFTNSAVDDAFAGYWACADQLKQKGVQRIVQMGVPPAALMGRDAILGLIAETERRYGVPGGADIEMLVEGMHHLGVRKLAVGAFWPREVNDVIARYFEAAGIEMVGETSWPREVTEDPNVSLEDGMELVLELGRKTFREAPFAEGILLPGGSWPTLHAAPMLEAEFGKPVFLNMTALVWGALRRPGIIPPIRGWGRLLEG